MFTYTISPFLQTIFLGMVAIAMPHQVPAVSKDIQESFENHYLFAQQQLDKRIFEDFQNIFSPPEWEKIEENERVQVYLRLNGKIYYGMSFYDIVDEYIDEMDVDLESFIINTNCNFIAKDKNSVYLGLKKIPDANPATFAIIACPYMYEYTKDATKVFLGYDQIPGADPLTFEFIHGPYSKDKNNVYFENFPLDQADPKTFTGDYYYGKDNTHVYYGGKLMIGADPATFQYYPISVDGASLETEYSMDKNSVFLHGVKLEGADPKTFTTLKNGFYKDNQNYFDMNGNKVTKENYEKIKSERESEKKSQTPSTDNNKQENLKTQAPSRTEIEGYYTTDGKKVFFDEFPLEGINIKSFQKLDINYFKDKNGVYFIQDFIFEYPYLGKNIPIYQKIWGADFRTFTVIDSIYSKDAYNVFRFGKKIPGADAQSFNPLNQWGEHDYSKDNSNVYYRYNKIKDVDIQTFQTLGRYARDKQRIFYAGEQVGIIKNLFELELFPSKNPAFQSQPRKEVIHFMW